MSDLTDAVKSRRWLTVDQLCEVIEDRDRLLGELRNAPWWAIAQAASRGCTIYDLLREQETVRLRSINALYVHLAHMYRIILAWRADKGLPLMPVDETDYAKARNYWARVGARKGWGDPDAGLLREMQGLAQIDWGCSTPAAEAKPVAKKRVARKGKGSA